ncbi:MAG: hypothetical protein VX822_04910 [Candidatus Neomarinimicrobiota bacterium]|nr:hypothetical protein [Candidatus Neomarinimicrobiota bacterium]
MKGLSITTILLLWSVEKVEAQAYFTLPKNVWRVSVDNEMMSSQWISGGGKKGLPDEFFTLSGYGLKYYNHLSSDSKYDLVNLHEHYITAADRADEIIASFQMTEAASAWDDTLADFSQNFFGPDSVSVGGYITNPKRSLASGLSRIRIEYGISEQATFTLSIPNYSKALQVNRWGWRAGSVGSADLDGFIAYHTVNKAKFDDFFASQFIDNLGSQMRSKLEKLYNAFYTSGGSSSVLWAMELGTDPLGTSIVGTQFNPFSDSNSDTTTIDSLMKYYHPDRSASGLGDIDLGLNFHLLGSPIWEGESLFSLYAGLGLIIPTARLVGKFNPNKVDSSGRPNQFNQLELGSGVTAWHFSLFGEFYRTIRGRKVKVNWSSRYKLNPEGRFWTRVSPRGTYWVISDTVLSRLGESYRFKMGDKFFGSLSGEIEIIPDKLAISAGQVWAMKRRDFYYSRNNRWNEWMAGGTDVRPGYDTRSVAVVQNVAVIFKNTDPMNQFGSTPFEIELSATIPLVTRHTWSSFALGLSFVTYFQSW